MSKLASLSNSDRDFLVNRETLVAWAGYSLQERCKLFHRRDISKTITPSQLRKVYKQSGIKKKAIRMVKRQKPGSKRKWDITEEQILDQLNQSDAEGRRFLCCDETAFNKYTNSKLDWSRPGQNQEVDKRLAETPPLTVIASISNENGVDHYEMHPRAIITP